MMNVCKITLGLIVTSALIAGCGHDHPTFSMLPDGQTFSQNSSVFNNQLDILWVIDNSGSMGPLQTNMTNNFNSFITNFQTKGYDFRMAVTTSDAYKADPNLLGYSSSNASMSLFRDGNGSNHTGVFVIIPTTPNLDPTFVTNATQGASGSGDERSFASMKMAMSNPNNPAFLRSTSFFAIIILSDEDDFSSNSRIEGSWLYSTNSPYYVPDHDYAYSHLDAVSGYESYFDTLTASTGAYRRWNTNAITVTDQTCLNSHIHQSPTANIGQRYMQMVSDTNGILGSVCDTSYATALSNIAAQIATLSTQFFLDRTPDVNTIVVQVNGAAVPEDAANGWTYNSTNNSIMFHGTYIPPQGATIVINFVPSGIKY